MRLIVSPIIKKSCKGVVMKYVYLSEFDLKCPVAITLQTEMIQLFPPNPAPTGK